MSTLGYVRMKVDMKLRQQDSKNRTYSVPEVDQAIREKYVAIGASLPPAHASETSAFTISGGGDTFNVTLSGTTYSDALDIRLQLASNGQFLTKLTVEELDAMRHGSPSVVLGVPQFFALWQDTLGVVKGRCYPGALSAQVVNMFRSLSQPAVTGSTLDTAAIYLNEAACIALASSVAAELLLAMPEPELNKRRLNRDIAKAWATEAQKLIYQEDARRADLETAGHVQRWVS